MTDPVIVQPKRYSREWEQVCPFSKRMETPDGWIFVYCENQRDNSTVFIPDADKEWLLKKVK